MKRNSWDRAVAKRKKIVFRRAKDVFKLCGHDRRLAYCLCAQLVAGDYDEDTPKTVLRPVLDVVGESVYAPDGGLSREGRQAGKHPIPGFWGEVYTRYSQHASSPKHRFTQRSYRLSVKKP